MKISASCQILSKALEMSKKKKKKKKKKNPQVSKEGLTSKTFEQFVCYEQQLRHSRIIFMKAGWLLENKL